MNEAPQTIVLTARIVTAYLAVHPLAAEALPGLIQGIHRLLTDLGPGGSGKPSETSLAALPAVDVRKSVFADHLVCLDCGKSATMLKWHLKAAHDLTPQQYRAKWALPGTYPIVAPDYAKSRSRLAKANGLGKRRGSDSAP